MRLKISQPVAVVFLTACSFSTSATSLHPVQLELTQGQSHTAIIGVGNLKNPAHVAFYRGTFPSDQTLHLLVPVDLAAEYGNVEELFEKLDELSSSISDSEGGGGGGSGDEGGINLDIDFNAENPNLEAVVGAVEQEVGRIAAFTALVALEGYARAEIRQELSLILNKDLFSGTFNLRVSRHTLSSAVGIGDEFSFNADQALSELQVAYDLQPDDPLTEFDLSGGVTLSVDPANENVSVQFDNDSLLLTKAARQTDVALNYSALWFENDFGALYWGVTPIFRQIGLTNIGVRFGDLVDSESLFERIEDLEFVKDRNIVLDTGLFWVSQNYSMGLGIYDLFPSTYEFPELENTNIVSTEVLEELERHRRYQSETQVTLDGSLFSDGGRWAMSTSLDTRSIKDPFKQDFQWASIRTDVFWNSWIVSNANLAVHRNLTGSKLTYVTVGADFLKYFSLDVTSTVDTTTLEDEKIPRGLNFSLGFRFAF